MLAFIEAHSTVLAGAAVGIIDLVINLIPSLAANGILHAVLILLQGKSQFASTPAPTTTTPSS
jgi:hypothetical protein